MRPADRPGGAWPTAQQRLILRAGLAADGWAAAWGELQASLDLDILDAASTRLLPLMARRLRRQGVEHAALARCAGLERYHWSRNSLLFHRGAAAVAALEATGIHTMLLKGAALVARYYLDAGLRPMSDLDVAVPAGAEERAIAVLQAHGWRPRYHITAGFRQVKHAAPFTDAGGRHLDLHWRVFEECREPDADRDLWHAAEPLDFQGVRTRALCAADQLLHVCVHGARWSPESAIRWVADAVMVLRSDPLDWDRLVAQAVKRRFVLRMGATLTFLHDELGAPVPAAALRDLARHRPARFERLEQRLLGREHRRLGRLPVDWCHHVRACRGRMLAAALSFPSYLRHAWALGTLWELPRGAWSRALRRARGLPAADGVGPGREGTAPGGQ
jgi:hypothetical protein